jgi:hypothetical protein
LIRLRLTESLHRAAARCVWFEQPETAIEDVPRLAAYILTYGTLDDVAALRAQITLEQLQILLSAAPPGIFDSRSWSYWHVMTGHDDPPPLPQRRFGS